MIDSLSIYLAKLLGLAFIIIGIALFSKPQDYQSTMRDISKSNAMMTFVSVIPLIIGLALVLRHNIWILHWVVVITIISWLILFAGIIRIFFHKQMMHKFSKIANKRRFFIWFGIFMFVVGIYLAGKGFFENKFFF